MHRIVQIDSKEDFQNRFDTEDGVMVDIRGAEDYKKGHLEGALHLDLMSQGFISYFSDLDRDAKVLLYCTDGSRSKVAVRILTEIGFYRLYNIAKGITTWDGTLLS